MPAHSVVDAAAACRDRARHECGARADWNGTRGGPAHAFWLRAGRSYSHDPRPIARGRHNLSLVQCVSEARPRARGRSSEGRGARLERLMSKYRGHGGLPVAEAFTRFSIGEAVSLPRGRRAKALPCGHTHTILPASAIVASSPRARVSPHSRQRFALDTVAHRNYASYV